MCVTGFNTDSVHTWCSILYMHMNLIEMFVVNTDRPDKSEATKMSLEKFRKRLHTETIIQISIALHH